MQSVLSERFENRIINLDQYAAQQAESDSDPTDSTVLQDLMTVKDIKRVSQLQVFATFVVDELYPRIRSSSSESSYFSYDLEEATPEEPADATNVNDDNGGDAGAPGTRRL